MKRYLIYFFVIAFLATSVNAKELKSGYRGFFEWDNHLTRYDEWIPGNGATYYYTGISTSHGYQITPYIFAGAGLAIDYCGRDESLQMPLFLKLRTEQRFGRFTPFADLRGGYTLSDGDRWNLSPTIGYRFDWGRKVALNIGVGATVDFREVEIYDVCLDESTGYWTLSHAGQDIRSKLLFTFRVGIDF